MRVGLVLCLVTFPHTVYINTNLTFSCRKEDESLSLSPTFPPAAPSSSLTSLYSPVDLDSPRDIVPRAAPSRPHPIDTSPHDLSTTSPAMSALRSIHHGPPSPPSASIWPWRTPTIVEPTSAKSYSFKNPGGWFSTRAQQPQLRDYYQQDNAQHQYDLYTTMGRPLAPKKPGQSVRPKSIELMQPLQLKWD